MAVCPFYDIENEYRVIVLDDVIRLVYTKIRPFVIGDGVSTLSKLIASYIEDKGLEYTFNSDITQEQYNSVIANGETYYLNWRHNLGQGSEAKIVATEDVDDNIKEIVQNVYEKMNARFVSIDIIQSEHEYKVLEINSGVMMENFSKQDDEAYKITKEIYKAAIFKMFD